MGILSTDVFGRGDIVFLRLHPLDDLSGGLIIRLSAFSIKFCHDVVQADDADLRVIGEFQHAPANWGRWGNSPIHSLLVIMLWNAL
jgi:hypothetical protein